VKAARTVDDKQLYVKTLFKSL